MANSDGIIKEACNADLEHAKIYGNPVREIFTAGDLQYLYQEHHSDSKKRQPCTAAVGKTNKSNFIVSQVSKLVRAIVLEELHPGVVKPCTRYFKNTEEIALYRGKTGYAVFSVEGERV